jgi:hypothetical protein
MIEHYNPYSNAPTRAWMDEMFEMDREDSWTPAQHYRRVVSLDFISGCADGGIIEEAA